MLDGPVTDVLESRALSHRLNHVDIFSASWGPDDDGKTVEGPGVLASKALQMGIEKARVLTLANITKIVEAALFSVKRAKIKIYSTTYLRKHT